MILIGKYLLLFNIYWGELEWYANHDNGCLWVGFLGQRVVIKSDMDFIYDICVLKYAWFKYILKS